MNTSKVKLFAQQARKKGIQQIAARLELILTTDSAELREKAAPLKKPREAINQTSKEQVIDKVAYTWFNLLMALRFMDANNYQPIGMNVPTPKPDYTLPVLLDEAEGFNPNEIPSLIIEKNSTPDYNNSITSLKQVLQLNKQKQPKKKKESGKYCSNFRSKSTRFYSPSPQSV